MKKLIFKRNMNDGNIIKVNFDEEEFYIYDSMPQWWDFKNGSSDLENLWEKSISQCIKNELKPNWNFADVGASFGGYALLAAKRTNGHIYAFEPNNDNFNLLQRNLSKFKNARCFNKALGDENKSAFLKLVRRGAGGHKVCFGEPGRSQQTEIITLDSLNIKIDMMKIDVEGFGVHVLKGALKTLTNVKIVIFELHGHEGEAIKILSDNGFYLDHSADGKNHRNFIARR